MSDDPGYYGRPVDDPDGEAAALDQEHRDRLAEATADAVTDVDEPAARTCSRAEPRWVDVGLCACGPDGCRLDVLGHPLPAESASTCGRCGHAFDPADTRFDGGARYRDTRFCRGCISRCHESSDFGHTCPICQAIPL